MAKRAAAPTCKPSSLLAAVQEADPGHCKSGDAATMGEPASVPASVPASTTGLGAGQAEVKSTKLLVPKKVPTEKYREEDTEGMTKERRIQHQPSTKLANAICGWCKLRGQKPKSKQYNNNYCAAATVGSSLGKVTMVTESGSTLTTCEPSDWQTQSAPVQSDAT